MAQLSSAGPTIAPCQCVTLFDHQLSRSPTVKTSFLLCRDVFGSTSDWVLTPIVLRRNIALSVVRVGSVFRLCVSQVQYSTSTLLARVP